MVHPAADIVLLSLVALRGLVIVPRLLLLWILPLPTVVLLPWGILDIWLGTIIGEMSRFSTLEANIATGRSRVGVSHRCTGGSVLSVLREVGEWCQLSNAWSLRSLLTRALILILPIVDRLTSRMERCPLWRCKAGAVVA